MKTRLVTAILILGMPVALVVHAQPDAEPPPGEHAATAEVSMSYVAEQSAAAKPKTWQDKKWNFTIAPYLIFPFMNGSVTFPNPLPAQTEGVNVDVDLNTGDILKRLNWFLMLYFEAKHPKFSIATDVLYMNLGQGGQLPVSGRNADFGLQQLAAELVVFGQIVRWFELGGGGRVNFVQSEVNVPAGMVLPALGLDFRKTWFDPLIAVRFLVPFKNDHWRLALRADVGGFTLGSTYAWQVYPYGGYNFDGINGKRVFELGAAFRAIGMKYETGSGPDRFVYDMIIWCPLLGFLFHF